MKNTNGILMSKNKDFACSTMKILGRVATQHMMRGERQYYFTTANSRAQFSKEINYRENYVCDETKNKPCIDWNGIQILRLDF